MTNKWILGVLVVFLIGCQSNSQFGSATRAPSATPEPQAWSYEAGPEPTAMGKELIALNAKIPNMPDLSVDVMGQQKFRPAFGPIPWRMLQQPNSVKILFIGQDGTHVAEAAGRPATAGFGGRAQDLANFFGVDYSAAFINTYAFTIRGQYGAFSTPYLRGDSASHGGVTDNGLWLISHDLNSPLATWRNDLIDWIIRNNRDSLKMIVLFGGAARDAVSTFVVSKGGKVGTRFSEDSFKDLKFPETRLVYAGGNNEFPVPIAKTAKTVKDIDRKTDVVSDDFYAHLLGRVPAYAGTEITEVDKTTGAVKKIKIKGEDEQALAIEALKKNPARFAEEVVFAPGGLHGSGLIHPAQFGGYDLDKISINGESTISLNGIKLSDGTTLNEDILIVDLPHPTALTNKKMDHDKWLKNPIDPKTGQKKPEPQTPEAAVRAATTVLNPYREKGWKIVPDHGQENRYDQRLEYKYGRGYIGPEYYDFGTPKNRMVSVSDAVRHSPPVIILGTRDRAPFDETKIQELLGAQPAEVFPKEEMFIARPRTPAYRDVFDRGPGEVYAKLMKQNLDMSLIGAVKKNVADDPDVKKASGYDREDVIREKFGITAFNIKTDPNNVGDFGHYRGTFEKPRVVVLADPDSPDDVLTSRALTGARGQYLHRLMKDIGVGDKYLVFKTVPFGMDGATDSEWATVLEQTKKYRDAVLEKVLTEERPTVAIADGPRARAELSRILLNVKPKMHFIALERGATPNAGIAALGIELKKMPEFKSAVVSGQMANIPRSHLPYYSRLWEGTSGDRVLDALIKPKLTVKKEDKNGKITFVPVHESYYKGLGFAVVAPNWATQQKAGHTRVGSEGVRKLKNLLCENGLRLPSESIPDYLKRAGQKPNCAALVP